MTTNMIFGGVGVVMSLLVAYVPGFKSQYEKLGSQQKQLANLAFIALLVAGGYALSYLGYLDLFAPGDWWGALQAFIAAMIANAGTYKSTNYLAR